MKVDEIDPQTYREIDLYTYFVRILKSRILHFAFNIYNYD